MVLESSWREDHAWRSVRKGWKPLYGCFQTKGVSFEWHDFETRTDLDWAKSFHPDSVEICLNLSGDGMVGVAATEVRFSGECAGFYRQGSTPLRGVRKKGRHQFITVEYSRDFLSRRFQSYRAGLHPLIAGVVSEKPAESGMTEPARMRTEHGQLIQSLRNPPIHAVAQPVWFESKALELAASFFFVPDADQELFCDRQKRLARDRCEQVIALLRSDLCQPLPLEALGKKVGCSHFHLSRTFSKEMGITIAQYLRKLRMERAAELLKSGSFNVTQAAMEVGYSSLSHFSQAFHESYGCCPGLYGIAPHHSQG
jgi:AraC-like DNA-binding protein